MGKSWIRLIAGCVLLISLSAGAGAAQKKAKPASGSSKSSIESSQEKSWTVFNRGSSDANEESTSNQGLGASVSQGNSPEFRYSNDSKVGFKSNGSLYPVQDINVPETPNEPSVVQRLPAQRSLGLKPSVQSFTSEESPPNNVGGTNDQGVVTEFKPTNLKAEPLPPEQGVNGKIIGMFPNASKIAKAAANDYLTKPFSDCENAYQVAYKICPAGKSKMDEFFQLMSMTKMLASSVGGLKNACNNGAKTLDIVQVVFTGIAMSCETARAACELSCSTALSANEKAMATIQNDDCAEKTDLASNKACLAANNELAATLQKRTYAPPTSDGKSVKANLNVCTADYVDLMKSVTMATISAVQMKQTFDACKKKADDDSSQVAAQRCVTPQQLSSSDCVYERCQKAEFKTTNPECICMSNPRQVGCANTLVKALGLKDVDRTASTGASSATVTNPGDLNAGTQASQGASPVGGAGKKTADVGGGGSGAPGASGGLLGRDSNKERGAVTTKRSDIFGGMEGSGGLIQRRPSASEEEANKRYGSYMPGGANAPQKSAWSQEVTADGGRSNFEKVHRASIDQASTLKP